MSISKNNPTGFYWHIHHDELLEWSDNISKRIDFVISHKPNDEIETRLRLMKPVKGKLPAEVVKAWKARGKAWEARGKAREAYDKAREAYDKAWEARGKAWKARGKAWEAREKAREAYVKAWEAYDEAWEAYDKALRKHKKEIEALHRKECPDCPWDGNTIFPGKVME